MAQITITARRRVHPNITTNIMDIMAITAIIIMDRHQGHPNTERLAVYLVITSIITEAIMLLITEDIMENNIMEDIMSDIIMLITEDIIIPMNINNNNTLATLANNTMLTTEDIINSRGSINNVSSDR
jgi:hypothetical protein